MQSHDLRSAVLVSVVALGVAGCGLVSPGRLLPGPVQNAAAQAQEPAQAALSYVRGVTVNPLAGVSAFAAPGPGRPGPGVASEVVQTVLSPQAPAVIVDSIRWVYVGALVAGLAAGIAIVTGHPIAAVKFGFAAVAGVVLAKVVSVVVGSFVLVTCSSFALGLVVAWWILKGKADHSGFSLEAWVNAKAQAEAQQVAAMRAKLTT